MTETVNMKAPTPEMQVLRKAIQAERTRKGRRLGNWPGLLPKVTLTVDGVEVPFIETLRELLDEQHMMIEDRAKDLAWEMLSMSGLDVAQQAIADANVKIARVINKVAGAIPDT